YRDREVRFGFDYLYVVTSVFTKLTTIAGAPVLAELESPLTASFGDLVQPHAPSRPASGQVWVVPNPYHARASWERSPVPGDVFTRHVDFMGLPRARTTIRIYTLAGDLVQVLDHDASNGDGQVGWNLISRNGQDVESGVYLFTVESSFGHQVGKFVLIRGAWSGRFRRVEPLSPGYAAKRGHGECTAPRPGQRYPMMRAARISLAAVAVLAIASTPSIAASPWVPPIAIGTQWEYRGDAGGHQVQTITGQTTVRGRVVSVKSYAEGTDSGLQNFWLLDAGGSLLLAGFRSPSAAVAVAYEPPLVFMPVPPGYDPYPVQHIVVPDLVTDAVVSEFDFQIQTFAVQLQLEFDVTPRFVVGVAQLSPPPGTLTLDGR